MYINSNDSNVNSIFERERRYLDFFLWNNFDYLGGAFVIAIIVAVKEIRKYNYLLEHGKIVEGKIISYSTHIQQGVTVKATYCDEKNGREYIYISKSPTVILFNMRYFVHQDPSINLLIDEKDMRNGVVLIDEYYNEKQEKYGDEPYQLRKIFKR